MSMRQAEKRWTIRMLPAVAAVFVLFCTGGTALSFNRVKNVPQQITDPVQSRKTVTVRGHVGIYGSEPHTFPGIVTDEGKQYTIQAQNDVLVLLQAEQGRQLLFTGTVVPRETKNAAGNPLLPFQTLKDGTFLLESWKRVSASSVK